MSFIVGGAVLWTWVAGSIQLSPILQKFPPELPPFHNKAAGTHLASRASSCGEYFSVDSPV
jgi:hypothetical protein